VTADAEAFADLVREWQAGSPRALAELYDRFSGHIRVAVRRRLHDRLRAEYDSLDFVQDVWASVAAISADRRTFPTPEALVGFLTRVASNKVVEVTRQRFHTQRRDIAREQPLPVSVPDAQPSPSQRAMGEERWREIVAQFPAGQRAVLERLREGYTHQEIVGMTAIPLRTVERIVRRLKDLCGE
jgi:RNA polymerase sigma factor (sigma-70 family)